MTIEPVAHELKDVLPPVVDGDDVARACDPDELLIAGPNALEGALRGVGSDPIVIARLYHERWRFDRRQRTDRPRNRESERPECRRREGTVGQAALGLRFVLNRARRGRVERPDIRNGKAPQSRETSSDGDPTWNGEVRRE